MLADGRMESIECREENGELVFAVSAAAVYGIVGGAAEAEAVLERKRRSSGGWSGAGDRRRRRRAPFSTLDPAPAVWARARWCW